MFRTVPLSIIRSFSLYTQQWFMSYCLRAGSGRNVLCVQWKTPDDGQRNFPKHVEFYSKNKFEKLVYLVGFIIRIYHDARSPERIYIYIYMRSKHTDNQNTNLWNNDLLSYMFRPHAVVIRPISEHVKELYTSYYGGETSLLTNYVTIQFLYIQNRIKICVNGN